MQRYDRIRVLVDVPVGTRDHQKISEALYYYEARIVSVEVVVDAEEWEKRLDEITKEPPVS